MTKKRFILPLVGAATLTFWLARPSEERERDEGDAHVDVSVPTRREPHALKGEGHQAAPNVVMSLGDEQGTTLLAQIRERAALPPSHKVQGERTEDGHEQRGDDVQSTDRDPAISDAVTPAEAHVLAMYEDMQDAFEQHSKDCHSMAQAVSEIVDSQAEAVAALHKERGAIGSQSAVIAQQRVEAAAGGQMVRLRESIRATLARCPNEDKLLNALRKLATIQTPQSG